MKFNRTYETVVDTWRTVDAWHSISNLTVYAQAWANANVATILHLVITTEITNRDGAAMKSLQREERIPCGHSEQIGLNVFPLHLVLELSIVAPTSLSAK